MADQISMKESNAILIADEIINMFEQHGGEEYAGEAVTQLQHMFQAGELARNAGSDDELILAAFLHDIGHICVSADQHAAMDGYGIMDHEDVGAQFLDSRGFSSRLQKLVAAHVDAKRYLTYADPVYYNNLSDASKITLQFQGGPMTEEEAFAFEADSLFPLYIQLRKWDELAKDTSKPVTDLQFYHQLIIQHLNQQHVKI